MKSRLAVVIAALATGLTWPVMAAPALNCTDPQTQSEMNMCADQDFRAADAQLNATYRQLAAKLDAHSKALLVDAERAWVAFRDKECTFETVGNEGGSIRPMLYSGCLTTLTKARTRDLKAQAACANNAESCQ